MEPGPHVVRVTLGLLGEERSAQLDPGFPSDGREPSQDEIVINLGVGRPVLYGLVGNDHVEAHGRCAGVG